MRLCRPIAVVTWLLPATAMATVLVDWSLAELVARADSIVIGQLGAQRYAESQGRVVTDWPVQVERTLLGPQRTRLVVSQLGGVRHGVITEVLGTAQLRAGARVVLITRQERDGRHYPVGMARGVFELDGTRLCQQMDVSVVDSRGNLAPSSDPACQRLETLERAIKESGR